MADGPAQRNVPALSLVIRSRSDGEPARTEVLLEDAAERLRTARWRGDAFPASGVPRLSASREGCARGLTAEAGH